MPSTSRPWDVLRSSATPRAHPYRIGARCCHLESNTSKKKAMSSRVNRKLENSARVCIMIDRFRANGITEPGMLADALNAAGLRTNRGAPWSLVEILRFQARPRPAKQIEAVLQLMRYKLI